MPEPITPRVLVKDEGILEVIVLKVCRLCCIVLFTKLYLFLKLFLFERESVSVLMVQGLAEGERETLRIY